jgi:hypothetical protein
MPHRPQNISTIYTVRRSAAERRTLPEWLLFRCALA